MWDFFRDGKTGDWVFSGDRDFSGTSGSRLTQQRVQINLKIPMGQYIYNPDLGSRLYEIIRHGLDRGMKDAPDVIREALETMTDISVDEIQITSDEDRLIATMTYRQLAPTDFSAAPLDTTVLEVDFSPVTPSGQTHFAEGV